jgi:Na+:H+ antiporter, NhaA family
MSSATAKLNAQISERDHAWGLETAPVVLVEYGDYECPYCFQSHQVIQELKKQLGGRFRYVFRHLPQTRIHPHAELAAQAVEAAAAQNKFWEMHHYLFEHQDRLDENALLEYAGDLGLDVEQFRQELNEGVYQTRLAEDVAGAEQSGARGTPTFFINGKRYDGPWDLEALKAEIERPLALQVKQFFGRFAEIQASGGIVLLISTIVALIWANSTWSTSYFSLWETKAGVVFGNFEFKESLLHWVNDGLMVLFFFTVGLEIKRELLVGELATFRKAILPVMAAIGGMVVPGLIYTLFNFGTEAGRGWGVPAATDIAFTLGVLLSLGSRVPVALRIFFAALAIADDLGAVVVIAVFYSSGINGTALLIAAVLFLVLVGLNLLKVRSPLPYSLIGFGVWLAFFESGVHPTIAGVLVAFTIPARSLVSSQAFLNQSNSILEEIEGQNNQNEAEQMSQQQAVALSLEAIAERLQTPAQRLEHALNPWVTYLILPIFALANAGVQFGGDFAQVLTSPISLGIIGGLVIGKTLGVSLLTWLTVKLGWAELPEGVGWRQLFCAAPLAGIGFTMALFIAESAFVRPQDLAVAKTSILLASLLSALIGVALILTVGRSAHRQSQIPKAVASN